MAVTGSELVEHAWLENFLDAQTNTIASGTRPTQTTNTTDQYTTVLQSVTDSHHQHLHHHHQQQQPPQRVHSEHSYSLDNDNGVDFNVKIEPEEQGEYTTTVVCSYCSLRH